MARFGGTPTTALAAILVALSLAIPATASGATPAVVAGASHSVGLGSDGGVVAVGNNDRGQCEVAAWSGISAVAAGGYHTVGVKSDGTVVATGSNDAGQCAVSMWTDIVAIAAGRFHTVGLKSDGTVVATGDNSVGQCNVLGMWGITDVAAGEYHTLARMSDGHVWSTGSDSDGQVSGVWPWSDIDSCAAGGAHSVGLRNDGSVNAVGYGGNGRLDTSGWSDIAAVAAGGGHTLGLGSDGSVLAVGDDASGQCQVAGWTGIREIAAGAEHSLGLKTDGSVVATGANADGQCEVSDWVLLTHLITASPGAHGTISPTSARVPEGGDGPFTITPDPGYHVADVRVDGISVGAVTSYTFTNVTADHTISSTFAANAPATVVDRTPPTASHSFTSATGGGTFTISAIDDHSGVALRVYQVDGGAQINYSGPFVITPGTHTVTFWAVDVAGNTSAPQSITVTVKDAPKLGKIAISTVKPKRNKTFTVSGKIGSANLAKNRVRLTFQRKVGGKWKTVTTKRAAFRAGARKYSVKLRLSKAGSYRVRAVYEADAMHVYGASSYRTFKVK